MKLIPVLLASAAFAFAAPVAAQVQADTVDTSLPTQLPRTAVPHHYAVTVIPHADAMTFNGNVAIDLNVVQPTRQLTLNAADMSFANATLSGAGITPLTATVAMNADEQTATLTFPRELAPGAYRLTIEYSGKINTQANGLFALDYKNPQGAQKRALFTQFEPSDARRFVPSWDEPDYKATWDVSAVVPAGDMAVSNMPATRTEEMRGGLKRVTFARTPQMSSYLLFFGTGEFGRIKKMAGKTEVGIVMGRGNESKAQTALDAEAQILPYYNSYFGVDYPLPKLDNVAGPGQSQFFSAMENWGAIFTFERVLLDDPAVTTESERQAIFGVEAHEMAHQWFGDLVTMAWWDDLWLNEGFASWMGTKATKHFHPDWGAEFDVIGSRESAMRQDSLITTHPVVQQVRTVEQANQAFDSITYSKGESVISMLEGYAGADVWQKGIQAYVRRHAYQNTRTDDLWQAVEQAGATGLTQMAHDFTLQPGVPLIRVGAPTCQNGVTHVTLTQGEFSVDRAPGSFQPLGWHVPVRAMTLGGKVATGVTQGRETGLEVPGCGPLIVNAGQTGYYRSLYQPAVAQQLRAAFNSLDAVDQYGLVEDQVALASANYQPMGVALDFVSAIPVNARPELIGLGLGEWDDWYELFDGDAANQKRIAAIIEQRYAPVLAQIGLVPRPGEKPTVTTLRPQLIGTLGRVGDRGVTAEAARLFAAMQTDPNAVPGGLKRSWLAITARNANAATWEQIHAMARNASSATERQNLYSLLGSAKDEALARRALELALTDEPGKTVSAGMISSVSNRHPELALDFVMTHWNQVSELVDATSQSRYVARLASGSDKAETVTKLQAYANQHIAASSRKPIDQAVSTIKARVEREPRVKSQIAEWLRTHGTAPAATAPTVGAAPERG